MKLPRLIVHQTIFISVFYASLTIVLSCALLLVSDRLFNAAAYQYHHYILLEPTIINLLLAAFILLAVARSSRWLLGIGILGLSVSLIADRVSQIPILPESQLLAWGIFTLGWCCWPGRRTTLISAVFMLCQLLVLIIASIGLLGGLDILPVVKLGSNLLTSLNTAIFLLLLALAGIACGFISQFERRLYQFNVASLVTLMIIVGFSLLWLDYFYQRQNEQKQVAQRIVVRLEQSIQDVMEEQRLIMSRLSERLGSNQLELTDEYIQFEQQQYLSDFTYIDYIAALDGAGGIQFSRAKDKAIQHQFDEVMQNDPAARASAVASDEDKVNIILVCDQSIENAFVIANIPYENLQNIRVLAARMDILATMQKAFNNFIPDGYVVNIRQSDGAAMLYTNINQPNIDSLIKDKFIELLPGAAWQFKIYTEVSKNVNVNNMYIAALLLIGWFTTLLALASQLLLRQNEARRQDLLRSNTKLTHSIHDLKALQLHQQQILENAEDMICVVDEHGCFTQVSRSCKTVLGYYPKELIGKPHLDLVLPAEQARTMAEIDRVRDGRPSRNFRNRYIRKDGSVVHLMWSSRYNAKLKTLYGSAIDISALVKAEHYQAQQQQILSMISQEQPLAEILAQICLLAEQQNGQVKACVMEKQGDSLRLLAALSLNDNQKAMLSALSVTAQHSPCSQAVVSKNLVQADNLTDIEQWPDIASLAQAEQLQSCWSMPVLSKAGQALGSFDLYFEQRHKVDANDLELLTSCSQYASLAMQRAAEKRQLLISEQRFRSLFQYHPDAICAVNSDGILTAINDVGLSLLNAGPDIIGQIHIRQITAPAQLDNMLRHFSEALAGEVQSYESVFITNDGRELLMHVMLIPMWVDNRIAGVFGIAKDITQKVQSEQQLRLFKRAVDATPNGVVISDIRQPNDPVIYVNQAFEKLTGYSAAEVIGKNNRFLQGHDPDPVSRAQIQRAITQREECNVIVKDYRKDNSLFWNHLYLAPVPDEQGNISHYVGIQTDITAQKRYEQELSYNASHDLLTGLPNRNLLQDRLTQACQLSRRLKQKIALLYIDLDGFKQVNDSLSHASGDALLKQIAQRIDEQNRPGDTLARLGGDEFVLLLINIKDDAAVEEAALQILGLIAAPLSVDEQELSISASIGITLSDGDIAEPAQLIQRADMAMYRAKQSGKNTFQWYKPGMDLAQTQRLNLKAMLKKAINNNDFTLCFQPQIDAVSGDVIGLEALIRWHHVEHGNISPNDFIPLAEETGDIIALGNMVFEQAMAFNQSLINRNIARVTMAVNVSSVQMRRADFVQQIKTFLDNTQLDPSLFEVELTESLLFENTEQVIEKLNQLKKLGINISIDDFGTGFSSLNYLKRLPLDKLKIDRSFINDVITDKRDAAICRAIIAMAHQLDIKVIAEGVETEAQMAFLHKNHCDEYQGYYFAKPMTPVALEQFLLEHSRQLKKSKSAGVEVKNLLLLDDEENILNALKRTLRREPYNIITCTSARQAFEALALNEVQVIVSDQRMPEMSGTEFLSQVKDLYPDTVRMVLSGYTDLRSVTDAVNQGAISKFMTKPWQDDELRDEIRHAFSRHLKQMKQQRED